MYGNETNQRLMRYWFLAAAEARMTKAPSPMGSSRVDASSAGSLGLYLSREWN
jgi:hypothetical protein